MLEANSRNTSSKWLEKTLAPARFQVDYTRGGDVLALDAPDEKLDAQFRWLDEKQAEACGKWSGYWAGDYAMKYLGGGPPIKDHVLIWGDQEQPHGCMQYTMKTTPGKDHLIRIRTWPWPKKGFTLQVLDKPPDQWKVIETIWVPQPKDPKENGWVDVDMTLPAQYVTGNTTVFRIGEPKGSDPAASALPATPPRERPGIWIRDSLRKAALPGPACHAQRGGGKTRPARHGHRLVLRRADRAERLHRPLSHPWRQPEGRDGPPARRAGALRQERVDLPIPR